MILLVGGWYFIICGISTVLPLLLGMNSGSDYLGWISAPIFLAVGIGLLKRTNWSRWMAFGMSLVGWTLGALLLLFFLYFIFGRLNLDLGDYFGWMFSKSPLKVAARMGVLAFILWVAGIVISYKLFWYLWSEEGCAEFGQPFGDTQTVVASTAAWIIGWLGLLAATGDLQRGWQGMRMAWVMTDPDNGLFGNRRGRGNDHYRRDDPERARREMRDRQLQKAMAQNNAEYEQRQRAQLEEMERQRREREILEAAQRAEQHSPDPVEQNNAREFEMPGEYAAQAQPPEDETTADSSKILKCRDASGSITFTQNYCPPGTQLVQGTP